MNREHKELVDYAMSRGMRELIGLWIFLLLGITAVSLYESYHPTHCTIETIRGTMEYGTSCEKSYGTLVCNEKTYGMYLSHACGEKKGEK